MKTLSLEQAVFEVIKDFDNNGQPFSAHDITTIVRNNVNSKAVEILNVPYGYVDATNTHSQHVNHVDVRDIIREMVDNNEVDVVSKGAYTIYRYKTITPVSTAPTSTTITNAITGVPSRFLVNVAVNDRQHITQYIRNKISKGFCPTLRSIQKAVKSKTTLSVEDVKEVIEAEGWIIKEGYAGQPLSYQTVSI